jgi:hypothetical protein
MVVNRPGLKADLSPPASVEVQNMWVYTVKPPLHILGIVRPGRKTDISPPASVEVQYMWVFHLHGKVQLAKHILGVNRPGRKAYLSPPASVEFQNMWLNTFTPTYIFMK